MQVVAEIGGGVEAGASAEGFEALGEEAAHAVGGGLIVAGGFDLDEFADGADESGLFGFEVAETVGPVGIFFGHVSYAPSGLDHIGFGNPRLAPWAAIFRRFRGWGSLRVSAASTLRAKRTV